MSCPSVDFQANENTPRTIQLNQHKTINMNEEIKTIKTEWKKNIEII